MHSDIEAIIQDGILAPSGENCQPWKFTIVGQNTVVLRNDPLADQSLYNFQQTGSFVAHGALIENMVISAGEKGYRLQIALFPDPKDPNLVAKIVFEKGEVLHDPLYPYLKDRHTNRKQHSPVKLGVEQKQALIDAAQKIGFGEFRITDDASALAKIGRAVAVNEQVIFENKELHDFFYGHVLWNEADQEKSGGFYFETLEFLPPQLKAVKLLKSWPVLRFLNMIGIAKKIAAENATKYASSGACGIVTMKSGTREDFVNAGRTIERVWLTATKLGLSVHPCTGTLYFMERIKGGDTTSFSAEHQDLIRAAYTDIVETFQTGTLVIPMLMMIGFTDQATARAKRMPLHITYE
jgi:hypothetical protein